MAVLCKSCGQANPADASYCYWDGSALLSAQAHGPLDLAQAPFAEPFRFSTGETCRNFDQLALTCQLHWQQTHELLRNGVFEAFLGRVGRSDLMRVAREAAAQPEADRGVDYFLSRLPTRNLGAPRLHVDPVPQQLGTLRPGQDRQLVVKLANHGHRLITGTITSDCPWLEIDGATADRPRLLQFPVEQTVIVRVAGKHLMAAKLPLQGKLLIATNAGSCDIPISCEVPIQPFPHGVMQGCKTPRELAQRAKHAPDEAAELFFNGTVKAWYAANGWVYPVEGEPASGKAAVQQFFEALGLTRPPRVVLDTPALGFQGPPGRRVTQYVELHSDEKRPIFAFGRSLAPWLSIATASSQGNRAIVAIEANIPHTSLNRLEGHIEVRSNGNQRFRIKAVLQIETPATQVELVPLAADAAPVAAPAPGGGLLPKALIGCALVMLLMLVGAAGGMLYFLQPEALISSASPLKAYATLVEPQTCAVAELNLDALGRTSHLEKETTQLQAYLAARLRDLDLQADDVQPTRLFVALAPTGPPLLAWTFAGPVKLGDMPGGRFDGQRERGRDFWLERFGPGFVWAVDAQGRLLHGNKEAVLAALDRGKTGTPSPTYNGLARAATGVAPEALAWAAGDFTKVPAPGVADALGGTAPRTFRLELVADTSTRQLLRAWATFATEEAAVAGRESLRPGFADGALPFVPASVNLNKYVFGAANWQVEGTELHARVALHPTTTSALIQVASLNVKEANQQLETALDQHYQSLLEPGLAAEKAGHFAQAADEFARVERLFPKRGDVKQRHKLAADAVQEQERYRSELNAARDAVEQGKLELAREGLERLKQSRFADSQLVALEKDLAAHGRQDKLRAALTEAERLLDTDLDLARVRLQAACKLNPASGEATAALAAVSLLADVQQAIRVGDEQLRDQHPELAQPTLLKGLAPLQAVKAPTWRTAAFTARRQRLLSDGVRLCQKVSAALTAAAGTARENAERLTTTSPSVALEHFETALARLDQAKALLAEVQRLDRSANVAAEMRTLDSQAAELQQGKRQVGGVALLARGNQALQQSKTAVMEARRDPSTIPAAAALLATALKCFREAAELKQPAAVEQARQVEELKLRLERLPHPVTLDPAADVSRADWSYAKERWKRKEADGRAYLRAEPGDSATLESRRGEWPTEFELELDFAIVDAEGRVLNQTFSAHTDPFTLILHHVDGTTTTLALGKDPANTFQAFARLQINRDKPLTADGYLKTRQPLHLVLRCQRPGDDNKRLLTVLLAGKTLCSFPFRHEVESVALRIAPPQAPARFVAIYKLDVAWLGAKDKE